MTYQEFLNIEYEIDKEEDYYCWVCANHHSKEDEEKYEYYRKRQKKIIDFKRKVLIEALKNISKDYFK